MLPANNDEIVLSSACENTDFSTFKEHLKFNFIPSKKMSLAQMFRCFLSRKLQMCTQLKAIIKFRNPDLRMKS